MMAGSVRRGERSDEGRSGRGGLERRGGGRWRALWSGWSGWLSGEVVVVRVCLCGWCCCPWGDDVLGRVMVLTVVGGGGELDGGERGTDAGYGASCGPWGERVLDGYSR